MRNLNTWGRAALVCLLTASTPAAEGPAIAAAGLEAPKSEKAQQEAPAQPTMASCTNRCAANDVKCGSEIRRAKTECARTASMAGRDPLTMRTPSDYSYFCGFFSNPSMMCGSDAYTAGCTARFQHRYGACLHTMDNDVAAMRFDCMKAEREAQRMCREELQDCKASCQ